MILVDADNEYVLICNLAKINKQSILACFKINPNYLFIFFCHRRKVKRQK